MAQSMLATAGSPSARSTCLGVPDMRSRTPSPRAPELFKGSFTHARRAVRERPLERTPAARHAALPRYVPRSSPGVHLQELTVSFAYPVYFTRDVFVAENPDLCAAITSGSRPSATASLAVVDRQVAEALPDARGEHRRLCAASRRPPRARRRALRWWSAGEAAKNDPAIVRGCRRASTSSGIDRHSFVVAHRRRGAARHGRLRRGDRAPRRPRRARARRRCSRRTTPGVGVKNGVNAFGKKNFLGTLRAALRGDQRHRASSRRCPRATASPAWPRR